MDLKDKWPNTAGFDTEYQEPEPVPLTVTGTIPSYAAGVLYRTGPLGFKIQGDNGKTYAANHWFDGLSAVHRFQIDCPSDGPTQVTYRSRRVVDELLEKVKHTGKFEGITFGAKRDPCKSILGKFMQYFTSGRDAPNVGVTISVNMPAGGEHHQNGQSSGIDTLHVKTDNTFFRKLDPETLAPEGAVNQTSLHADLKGPLAASHAKTDPETGDLFNYNLETGGNPTYRVFAVSKATGKTSILATFPGTPAYIHSLFITQNYVILCVWNSHIVAGGLPILWNRNLVSAIAPFDSTKPATWYVVDRRGSKGLVATYESDAFFSFHSINAWEQPSSTDPGKTDIITELCYYENLDVVHRFYYDNIISSVKSDDKYVGKNRESCITSFARYKLPSIHEQDVKKPVRAEVVYNADKMISGELATINPSYLTKPHRYIYAVTDRLKSSFLDGIVKFDNQTRHPIFWEKEGHTPGEPIFVPDPEGKAEDDGVLLTVVLDGFVGKSYLLCLKAKDLSELGRAEMDGPMSFGFHGAHAPSGGRKYGGDV